MKKKFGLFDSVAPDSDSSMFEPFESVNLESENTSSKRNGLVIFGAKSVVEKFMKNLDFFYRFNKVTEFKAPHEYFSLCYKITVKFESLNFPVCHRH
jgi:hypothetical protein